MTEFAKKVRNYLETTYKDEILLKEIQSFNPEIQRIPDGIYKHHGFHWKKHVLPVELSKKVYDQLPDTFKSCYDEEIRSFIRLLQGHVKFDTKYLNFLPDFRSHLITHVEVEDKSIKLHRGFHHLNSSQAMCFNYLFPLAREGKLEEILKQFGLGNEKVAGGTWKFEKESNIDTKKRIVEEIPKLKQNRDITPTSFDFYFETESGKKFFFEIKYTESNFSGKNKAKTTDEYLQKYRPKYERIYKEAAAGIIRREYDNEDTFLQNYQIMRNLIHLSKDNPRDNYVVFVIPEENAKVLEQAKQAETFVVDEYKENVKVLPWNDLIEIDFGYDLKEYYKEFWRKYKLAPRV